MVSKNILKKNFLASTIAMIAIGCTTTLNPTKTEIWAKNTALTYSKEAHLSYLECLYKWPNSECLQNAWETYENPDINTENRSSEAIKHSVDSFIKAMQIQGIASVLRDNGYRCQDPKYFDNIIFTTSKQVICKDNLKYKVKPKGKAWRIEIIDTGETKSNGYRTEK